MALHPVSKETRVQQCLKVLTYSGWNPPPGNRRMHGQYSSSLVHDTYCIVVRYFACIKFRDFGEMEILTGFNIAIATVLGHSIVLVEIFEQTEEISSQLIYIG